MEVIEVIKLGLQYMREKQMIDDIRIENPEEITHSLLHDLKNMVVDLQNVKERTLLLEERTHILMLENSKLRLLLEDICYEQSNLQPTKTRRKS
jgi:hypothetical protein